jgi:hypothetical protein
MHGKYKKRPKSLPDLAFARNRFGVSKKNSIS